jgi:hypothetical protein
MSRPTPGLSTSCFLASRIVPAASVRSLLHLFLPRSSFCIWKLLLNLKGVDFALIDKETSYVPAVTLRLTPRQLTANVSGQHAREIWGRSLVPRSSMNATSPILVSTTPAGPLPCNKRIMSLSFAVPGHALWSDATMHASLRRSST